MRYRRCAHGVVSGQCMSCLAEALVHEQAMLAEMRTAHQQRPVVDTPRCPQCDMPRPAHATAAGWRFHINVCNFAGEEPEGV